MYKVNILSYNRRLYLVTRSASVIGGSTIAAQLQQFNFIQVDSRRENSKKLEILEQISFRFIQKNLKYIKMSEKVHSQSALLTPKNLFEAMKDSDSKIRENQEETINGAEEDNNGLDTSNPQQNDDDDCKLFVGGLAQEATEKDITEYFGKFGKVPNNCLQTF